MNNLRHSFHDKNSESGFSLVELSIVLVILGLLTGGILTGQSLIRAAELRSITNEYNQYQTAIMAFEGKYLALPGDMPEAHLFWGAAAGDGTFSGGCLYASTGSGKETCSGDGNGEINGFSENVRGWQHLVNAEMIAGNYTGTDGQDSQVGVNIPASKFGGMSGWGLVFYFDASNGVLYPWAWREDFTSGQYLLFGSDDAAFYNFGDVLTPEEAWNIDLKVDDGKPGLGRLIVPDLRDCTTVTDNSDGSRQAASYQLTSEEVSCALLFTAF